MPESQPVYRPKPNPLDALFGRPKVVIGVIHSKPLPGSPGYDGEPLDDIYAFAVAEAERYARGGVHGLIVENHGDIPFSKPNDLGPETAATMAVMTRHVRQAVSLPIGVNVLANGAAQAIAIAQAADAQFIRVNQWVNAYVANEGIIEGPAARVTRYRAWLRATQIKIFADVHVKHGSHAIVSDRTIEEMTRDAEFFNADAVIATGQRTGDAAQTDEVRTIGNATHLPLLIGSGVTQDNVTELFEVADGVIVASSLKEEGVWWTPVSEAKVRAFMGTVNAL
ncbi:MAG: BtpA/SgcQ family protein [Trueperaceae bacterium]|nr:BtpA/SgcQ family protein [Trueperaceae bacterium]